MKEETLKRSETIQSIELLKDNIRLLVKSLDQINNEMEKTLNKKEQVEHLISTLEIFFEKRGIK